MASDRQKPRRLTPTSLASTFLAPWSSSSQIEQVHRMTLGTAEQRNVRVGVAGDQIGIIVAAALDQQQQTSVRFDE